MMVKRIKMVCCNARPASALSTPDAGSYEGLGREREDDQLSPEHTANGTNFRAIKVPEEAPSHLLCEECERRLAVGRCRDCDETLCAECLAILHIPSSAGHAHIHLAQGGIRTLRDGDTSTVRPADDDAAMPAHQIDEEEMAARRDLSVPSALDAPTIDFTGNTAFRNASRPLHTKGQLVVLNASAADVLPDHLADDDGHDVPRTEPHGRREYRLPDFGMNLGSQWRPKSRLVMSVPMARHGEWGHAGRRGQGHRLLVRVRLLARASRGYDEPFVGQWLLNKHRTEGTREPVKIVGGSGLDAMAREISAAKAADRRRQEVQRALVSPEHELGLGLDQNSADRQRSENRDSTNRGSIPHGDSTGESRRQEWCVVLVPEHELFTVEEKRKQLNERRLLLLLDCLQNLLQRARAMHVCEGMKRWRDAAANLRNIRWNWASTVLQRRTRGSLARMRTERRLRDEAQAMWEAGRRVHAQFHYLTEQERQANGRLGVTTDGRNFFATKAELNRFATLRLSMAKKAFKLLAKGVRDVKARTWKHWVRHTAWHREKSEPYVFSVARDVSLAASVDDVGGEIEAGHGERPLRSTWQHPSNGIVLPPLPQLLVGRIRNTPAVQATAPPLSAARGAATTTKSVPNPARFCTWLIEGSVLISSYLDAEGRARPRDFKQPPYPDAASQILLAGVGTLVCLQEERSVRRHESDNDLLEFDQAFALRHKAISAAIKVGFGEAKRDLYLMRQEEKNLELLRDIEGYDGEEWHKSLADVVTRMRVARSAHWKAKRESDAFAKDLRVVWETLPETDAPPVDDLVKVVVGLEDRLRAGEKLCLWSIRGHGRVGLVGAVLLGRLYGCTPEDALLRTQVCHDAREDLKGQPQISCPQTIAQVKCVREALLQMTSIYTDLVVRADLPASRRGVKVCKCIRGRGPPVLNQPIRVHNETQEDRYRRERERRHVMDRIQEDEDIFAGRVSAKLLSSPAAKQQI